MGCASCAARAAAMATVSQSANTSYKIQNTLTDCEYTDTRLKDFEDKLVWFKDRALHVKYNISASTVNKYIGIVLTSLNIFNKCTYKEYLDKISDLADFITTIQNS